MALTRLETVRREPFEDGRAFGETGPYERIDAVAHWLVEARYLLAGDIDLCVALAGERYDAVVNLGA